MRIFGPKRDENGEVPIMRSFIGFLSRNIVRVVKSRRLRWTGHIAGMKEGRSDFKMLAGKPTGKISLGRSRI